MRCQKSSCVARHTIETSLLSLRVSCRGGHLLGRGVEQMIPVRLSHVLATQGAGRKKSHPEPQEPPDRAAMDLELSKQSGKKLPLCDPVARAAHKPRTLLDEYYLQ